MNREGRLTEAELLFRHVVAESPNDHEAAVNLAMTVLGQGRLAEGARLYEARIAGLRDPGLPYPRWSGEPLAGKKVLVWPEQGLGDQIMVARYAHTLQSLGCDVTFVCAPKLQRLFAQSLPARALAAAGTIEFPDPDTWLWSMSLLAALGTEGVRCPPYLRANPRRSPASRIGVASRGSPTNRNDAARSLPPDQASELLAIPGAMSLLPEDTGAADMLETAEIIAGLDLVISVDTSIAHLAGAMGKAVWILLPATATDWRWLQERSDTPWYPSAHLVRQREPGDWTQTIREVKALLGDC